jgi:hypothetical protein
VKTWFQAFAFKFNYLYRYKKGMVVQEFVIARDVILDSLAKSPPVGAVR